MYIPGINIPLNIRIQALVKSILYMSELDNKYKLQKFKPPTLKFVEDFGKPFQFYFSTQFFGLDKIDPVKPYMFVTNHTVYGITDGFLFGVELFKRKGIFLRPLVDNLHFEIPVWRDKIQQLGFVRASRENCSALMQAGENILVFPGGGRETWKHKGEAYQLIWKNHLGFARMAIQHDYDIIPVAQVGGDDAFEIVADADDIMKSQIGKFLKQTGIAKKYFKDGDSIPPISRGLLGMFGIPKPVKLYISFGKPIDTTRFKHKYDNEEILWQLRNEVELSMDKQFIKLLEYRHHDTNKGGFWRKLLTR